MSTITVTRSFETEAEAIEWLRRAENANASEAERVTKGRDPEAEKAAKKTPAKKTPAKKKAATESATKGQTSGAKKTEKDIKTELLREQVANVLDDRDTYVKYITEVIKPVMKEEYDVELLAEIPKDKIHEAYGKIAAAIKERPPQTYLEDPDGFDDPDDEGDVV